jgi:hypothetical protein
MGQRDRIKGGKVYDTVEGGDEPVPAVPTGRHTSIQPTCYLHAHEHMTIYVHICMSR